MFLHCCSSDFTISGVARVSDNGELGNYHPTNVKMVPYRSEEHFFTEELQERCIGGTTRPSKHAIAHNCGLLRILKLRCRSKLQPGWMRRLKQLLVIPSFPIFQKLRPFLFFVYLKTANVFEKVPFYVWLALSSQRS